MKNRLSLSSNLAALIVFGSLLSLLLIIKTGALQHLDNKLYQQLINDSSFETDDAVLLVAIDTTSLHALGGWPLAPQHYTPVLKNLVDAKVVANTLSWHRNPNQYSLDLIDAALQNGLLESPDANTNSDSDAALLALSPDGSAQQATEQQPCRQQNLKNLAAKLDNSELKGLLSNMVLALPVQLNNLLQPNQISQRPPPGFSSDPLSDVIQMHRLTQIISNFSRQGDAPAYALSAQAPLPELAASVAGIGLFAPGDLNPQSDSLDFPLIMQYQEQYYPSLALLVATLGSDAKLQDILVNLGNRLQIKETWIHSNARLYSRNQFSEQDSDGLSIKQVSFLDVYNNRVPAEKFKDKIVLLGITAEPEYVQGSLIQHTRVPPVMTLAKRINALRYNQTVAQSTWQSNANIGLAIAFLLILLLSIQRFRDPVTVMMTVSISIFALLVMWFNLQNNHLWLSFLSALLVLWIAQLIWLLHRLPMYLNNKWQSPDANTEDNRLMGMVLQSQGKLEMAFNKFVLCSVDARILELLYNLSMDFERKRQTAQAVSVYRYIQEHNPDYRDIEQRIIRLQQQKKQPPRLGARNREQLSTWLDDSSVLRKPMLGRYQVEKRLAKGAMGVLYLGKDAKMNRMVALKTLALSEEFDGDQLQEATQRFFREAAAAGRLNHENIISVYDAGEENNLAYIAMEFFKGGNLSPYTNPDHLLDLDIVLDIIIKCASALGYAHKQGVIHRDVKPANIMYNPGTANLKLTDFGIARVTDSHKTRTGVILGTPSYMSPEQLSGKDLDGRADLFSLGVMFYQMVAGELPFKADSMASLMFQIANEPHPDILQWRPDLPPCIRIMINTLLEKQAARRYTTGAALVQALRECRITLQRQGFRAVKPESLDFEEDAWSEENDNSDKPSGS